MKRTWLSSVILLGACTAADTQLPSPDVMMMVGEPEPDMMIVEENRPPDADDDDAQTFAGVMVEIDVLDNDDDPDDGDSLDLDSVEDGAHGTTTKAGNLVRYTPSDDIYVGEDTFTYVAEDESGLTAEATVTVTIVPKPTLVIDTPLDNSVISTTIFNVTFHSDGCVFTSPASGGDCHAHKYLDDVGYPTGNRGQYTETAFDVDVTGLAPGVHTLRMTLAKNDGTDAEWNPAIEDVISFTIP